ncbi:DUF5819 family protein [Streptomyces aidingensis]|uniref:Uncharacterized protein n=1 Tax=Streptomyces aidingensis TaxID=910347 RepID=A0A1I1QP94_9ACTN|nr:DUF5819 family protein [Streptomyces aidingensis]SFD23931.1 hypothetical protein SAMN05421773_111210 [Streptomyces aidingensis]
MQPPEEPRGQDDGAEPAASGRDGAVSLADESPETVRFSALSPVSRLVIAVGVGLATVLTSWHLAAAFLFVAPENTVTGEYGQTIRDYIYPELEQNWKLFAPNPLQQNVDVEVRAEYRTPDGKLETTEWINLSGIDYEHIRHNLAPSHTAQNMLRRAWDFFDNSHTDGRPNGMRGELSGAYVHRIALLRLSELMDVDTVERLQLRSAIRRVDAPQWSEENIDTSASYNELDWWTVRDNDRPSGALAPDKPAEDEQ